MGSNLFDPGTMMISMWLLMLCGFTIGNAQETTTVLQFIEDLPEAAEYANTKGTSLSCKGDGIPKPQIKWLTMENNPVKNITDTRTVFPNGSIIMHPFRADRFRPDVHSTTLRCFLTNSAGTIKSRDVHLKAVVQQQYDVQVYDTYPIEGNTAVFKCHIPPVIAKYVAVVAWIKNGNLLIEPKDKIISTDKYMMLLNGDLHIRDVNLSESGTKYTCKTHHKLTGETKLSSAGNLFVTEPKGNVSPRILDTTNTMSVKEGEIAILACAFQGYPIPNLKWYTKLPELKHISKDKRFTETQSFLVIRSVKKSDENMYVCEAQSDIGKANLMINLTVASKTVMNLKPSQYVVNLGDTVQFQCDTPRSPIETISWFHNGKATANKGNAKLTIQNTQFQNKGMYQCFVKRRGAETLHSTFQLNLSEMKPYFIDTFKGPILQPGDPISMKCSAAGIPQPSISWILDGIVIADSNTIKILINSSDEGIAYSQLQIKSVKVQDGGVYSCSASNRIEEAKHSARINVHGKVGMKKIPNIIAVSGEKVYLNCPMFGYPWKSISWVKDGRVLPTHLRQFVHANGTLGISKVHRSMDSGRFKCIVNVNKDDKVEGYIDLQVMIPPKIVPFEFQADLLREGMRARLQCVLSEGDLPLNISWLKDGKPLSQELGVIVRNLDDFSSILTIGSITPSHNGNYTCVATNKAATASHKAQLSVNVRPKIVPLHLGQGHLEGSPARLVCGLMEGDPPVTFEWLKDDLPIIKSPNVSVHQIDGLSSILTIGRLVAEHTGNFTCIASNSAGSTNYTVQIKVNVPPRWVVMPKNTNATHGDSILLNCQAEGYPKPEIKWIQRFSESDKGYLEITNQDSNMELLSNGSLYIQYSSSENSGLYYCQASNGVGMDLSEAVSLHVFVPPKFSHAYQLVSARKNISQEIQCVAKGDSPLTITWFKNSKEISSNSSRNKFFSINSSTEVVSKLTINNSDRQDNGTYQCLAKNNHGTDTSTTDYVVQERPDEPKHLELISFNGREVTIRWAAPFNGNLQLKHYVIRYFKTDDKEKATKEVKTNTRNETSRIVGLTPATSYTFTVFAENEEGRSLDSKPLIAITEEEIPSKAPQTIHVESVNHEAIKITWEPPQESFWNGRILGYNIGFKEADKSDNYLFKTLLTADPTAHNMSVQIGGMKRHTKYSVVVQAYNNKGKGPISEPVMVMTSEEAPKESPTDVRCTTLTSTNVHVVWTPPSMESVNGILQGYKVIYKPSLDWSEEIAAKVNKTTSTAMTLTGLRKYTNYGIEVLSYTKSGDGPRSDQIFCKTLDDVPEPISNVKAFASSNESVILSWKSPQYSNGILESYSIYWRDTNQDNSIASHSVSTQNTYYDITSLRKGHKYEFWVTSSTGIGESKPSKSVYQTVGSVYATARIISFNSNSTATWKTDVNLECLAVGIPEVVRKWTFNGMSMELGSKINQLSDGTLHIKNISEKESGRYTCRIHNELGDDEINHTLTVLAPPSPPVVEIQTTSSNSIEIVWKTSDEKLAKITGLTIHLRKHDGEWKEYQVEKINENFHKMNTLECGTRYEVFMTANNKIGTSERSKMILVATNGSAPTQPSKSDLIEESVDGVSLYLNTWKSNGCPIHHYVVEYAQRATKEWNIVSKHLKPEQRRLMIPGLLSGTWYTLRMTANNAAGSSVAEYSFATLSKFGATIAPDHEVYETNELWSYLNFYIIIPVSLTALILIIILTISCCYVKSSNRKIRRDKEKRLSVLSNALNYAYLQKRNDNDDPTPYATYSLSDQPPPLPPPNGLMSQGLPVTPRRNDIDNTTFFRGIHPQLFPPLPNNIPNDQNHSEPMISFAPQQPKNNDVNILPTYSNEVENKSLN